MGHRTPNTKIRWARHTRFSLPLLPSGPGGVQAAQLADPRFLSSRTGARKVLLRVVRRGFADLAIVADAGGAHATGSFVGASAAAGAGLIVGEALLRGGDWDLGTLHRDPKSVGVAHTETPLTANLGSLIVFDAIDEISVTRPATVVLKVVLGPPELHDVAGKIAPKRSRASAHRAPGALCVIAGARDAEVDVVRPLVDALPLRPLRHRFG